MKKLMMRLMVAGVAAGLPLGAAIADLQSETRADVTQLCENAIGDKGYKGYRFEDIEFNEARSGYSVTGQISRGSHRYEFNCVVSTRMSITDLVINPLSGDDDSRSVNSGAPAEAQVACAEEADKYWGLKDGASVPGKSKSTGSGMYEVQVAGGHHRGICTVTEDGDVKGIMNQ